MIVLDTPNTCDGEEGPSGLGLQTAWVHDALTVATLNTRP